MLISGHDHNLQIVDIATKDYSSNRLYQVLSTVYPILKCIRKGFSENGYIYIDTLDNTINIMNIDNKNIYKDKLLYLIIKNERKKLIKY